MTPLAHRLVVDAALPVAQRRFRDTASRLRLLDGVHFFEVSDIWDMAADLAQRMTGSQLEKCERAFLAAPRMWIECRLPLKKGSATRIGWLLKQSQDGLVASATPTILGDKIIADYGCLELPLRGSERLGRDFASSVGSMSAPIETNAWAKMLYAFLAMINTPRVVGRRTHQPHAGLQRKIAAAHGMPGKYPLQAWHELVLEVTPPRDESDQEARRTILTGGKALHFCRAYLRIRNGQLELVSSHWRGDPALGIKQTRYAVVPPRKAA